MRKVERERRERQRLWIENLAPGRVLASQFLILEKAGSGAEGVVYLARDQFTRTEKAIKFYYNPEDAWHLKRLAHKMTHLQHENIVRHHGVGQVTYAGQPVLFLIMEPYDGHVLSHYQDRFPGRRLGLFEALKYFTDVIQALVYAHSRGFVHEDIHRENVVLHHDPHRHGREYVAKLNDFFPAGRTFEVKRRQVDIREAGFLLYEMLTGKMEYAARHLKAMPTECADLIRRCVHRDRARRFKHPRRVLEELRDMQWVS